MGGWTVREADGRSPAWVKRTPNPPDPIPSNRSPDLDVIGLQRREAVERHRRVGRGVGPSALDQHFVADLETDRQLVRLLLIAHVHRVAGRACEHAGTGLATVARRAG